MNRDRIEKLMEIVPAEEQSELTAIYNSFVETLKHYKDEDDPARRQVWLKANRGDKSALVELVETLENKYLTGAEQFSSLMEALRHLQKTGWKIQKSKLYKDVKDGLLKVNADKSVDEVHVMAYAAMHLEKASSSGAGDKAGELSESKIKAETDYRELQKERLQFEIAREKGQYIHRSKWLTELVGKLSAERFAMLKIVQNKAPDLIAAVGGDLRKESMFVELFTGYVEDTFNDLAAVPELRFAVVRNKDGDE